MCHITPTRAHIRLLFAYTVSMSRYDRPSHQVYMYFFGVHNLCGIRGVVFDRTLTGVCTADAKRLERVMSACACALHFLETGERKTDWYIVFPNLAFSENAQQEAVAGWSQFLSILGKMRLSKRTTRPLKSSSMPLRMI